MDFIKLFFSTVAYCSYVFGFLVLYFFVAVKSLGWKRTAVFTFVTWSLAFVAEYSSTRNGVPFGTYVYLEATRERELWIANVPFMDSLSFIFLSYASYVMALAFCLPVRKVDKRVSLVDNQRIRQSGEVWLLSMLFFVFLFIFFYYFYLSFYFFFFFFIYLFVVY
jgi:putative membrane protein